MSLSLLAAALLTVTPVAAQETAVAEAWSAQIGSAGAHGWATIQLYTTGRGWLVLRLQKLPPTTRLPVSLSAGTCAAPGSVILQLPAITASRAGAAARMSGLTAAQASAISAASVSSGTFALRVGTGSAAACGEFGAFPVQPYVAATISVGGLPHGAVVARSGVWVTNYLDDTLSRIDPATNAVLQTVRLPLSGNAGPEAIGFGEGSLWVTVTDFDDSGNPLAGSVLRVDPANGHVQVVIAVGRTPLTIATTPGAVWVPAADDNTLARIDPVTYVVTTIPVCTNPVGVTSGFGSVWVACADGSLLRIDPATNEVIATIQTGTTGGWVAAGDTAIWMANTGDEDTADGTVTRIDPATNTVVARVGVGSQPWAIAFASGSLWVGLAGTPTVVRVSAITNTVLAQITLDAPVYAIAATDSAVWAVQDLQAPDLNSPVPPGEVARLDYSGVTIGPFEAASPTTP
jgi:YVTN family beta-propeller protein